MKPNELTLKNALSLIAHKKLSVDELYGAVDDAVKKVNPECNIYLAMNPEARKQAVTALDTTLGGVPVAVKDNFLTVGIPTTASSRVLKGFMPQYESTVTKKMSKAGGIVYGKTNMDAWAHGSSTETSDFGTTKNPRNPRHLPGGSSGGSAAAVASDTCIVALGSETAGSIRQPSAWCGVTGLKPTYGRVSRAGVVAMGSSLDSPGPIGKTVYDTALVLNTIAGRDIYDATTSPESVPDFTASVGKSIKGKKIGITYIDHPHLRGSDVAKAIEAAGKVYESLGAHVSLIPLSEQLTDDAVLTPDYAIAVYTVVQRGEVSSNLARYDGIRYGDTRSTFGAEAKRRIMLGTFTLSKGYADKYYVKAQQVRSLYRENFKQLFTKFDALISPTSPGYALELGASAKSPMFGELEDMLLEPTSISGMPGINVPCFHDPKTNLYLGMNIVADMWNEETVISLASAYEQATEWNQWGKQSV